MAKFDNTEQELSAHSIFFSLFNFIQIFVGFAEHTLKVNIIDIQVDFLVREEQQVQKCWERNPIEALTALDRGSLVLIWALLEQHDFFW